MNRVHETNKKMEMLQLNGKIVGKIDEKKKIYISERTSDHFFRKFSGFGMSVKILNYLRSEDVETIIILYNGAILRASVQLFYEKGIPHRNELDKRDAQLVLPLLEFQKGVKQDKLAIMV